MAHEVTAKFHTKIVQRKDVETEVRTGAAKEKNKSKLGTLLISQGNIEWVPVGKSKSRRRLSWVQFAEMMDKQGKLVKAK